jgi:hypothetical protein
MSTSIRHGHQKRRIVKVAAYFQEVNSDVLGPIQVQSIDGYRYAIHFTELRSRYRWIYFMKHKDEALDKLKLFLAEIKLDGFSMRELRTDNGGEYVNDAFYGLCNWKIYVENYSSPHSNS